MIVAKTVRKLSCDHENAPPIEYLSNPSPVNMGDWWFDVANTEHFWIRRRFEVMRKLVGSALHGGTRVAEIGCGNGMLQRDIEDHYGIPVSGFELNELALNECLFLRMC